MAGAGVAQVGASTALHMLTARAHIMAVAIGPSEWAHRMGRAGGVFGSAAKEKLEPIENPAGVVRRDS